MVSLDSSKQAIYVFENDRKGSTVCYGTCAEAWPPVLTDGGAEAWERGEGIAARDGQATRRQKVQVTTRANRSTSTRTSNPGEVRCHNVNLNGGLLVGHRP